MREVVVDDKAAIIAELKQLAEDFRDLESRREQFLANEDRVMHLAEALGDYPGDDIIDPISNAVYSYGGKQVVIAAAEVINAVGTTRATATIEQMKEHFLYDYLIERFD